MPNTLKTSPSITQRTAAISGAADATPTLTPAPSVRLAGVPKEVPPDMTAEAQLLEAFAQVASVTRVQAHLLSSDTKDGDVAPKTKPADVWIRASLTQRNLPGNAQRKFQVQGLLPAGSTRAAAALVPEAPDAQLWSVDPTGRQQLVVKSPQPGNDSISAVLQLWAGNRVSLELHVPKTLHGTLLTGTYFAADVAWNGRGDLVAYVAERPAEERTPAWGGPEAIKDAAAPKSWRGVGTAVEDWGELHSGKRPPGVFVLDALQKSVVKISPPSLPSDVSFGAPCWTPRGDGLVLVGWPHASPNFPDIRKRLGVVFCYNRPAQLWFVPLARDLATGALVAGEAVQLTSSGTSALSPAFSPDGTRLVYISHNAAVKTGTHAATAQLCDMPWPEGASGDAPRRVVVDVVHVPLQHGASAGFPGLYTAQLPDSPFLDEDTLLVNTQWRSVSAILAVDLKTGALTPLTPVTTAAAGPSAGGGAPALPSYVLATMAGGRAFAISSAPDAPPHVVVADLPPSPSSLFAAGRPALQWAPVEGFGADLPPTLATYLANVECQVMQVAPSVGDSSQAFESLVWLPKSRSGPLPTILAPHGGPHTAITSSWFLPYAFLVALGYAVVVPNYRGSTGYGQAALQSLPGHIGRHDVDDCMAVLRAAVAAGLCDAKRVGVVGGSHGGFLSGHLLGQFPAAFRFAVLRNPVTNISLMVGLSDITDWCYVEVFGCEDGVRRAAAVAAPPDLERMYAASPVAHAHNTKAPVTLMLGQKDRRVPLPDGLQYAQVLRSAGVQVRTIVFPEDGHALDRVQTEFEQWLNVAWDAKTYLAA